MIFSVNDIINKKVICRSNEENEPLLIAKFIGNTGPHNMPKVEDENGVSWIIGGIIFPYFDWIVKNYNKLKPHLP